MSKKRGRKFIWDREKIVAEIRKHIANEDPLSPRMDKSIQELMAADGFIVPYHVITKVRQEYAIPGFNARRWINRQKRIEVTHMGQCHF